MNMEETIKPITSLPLPPTTFSSLPYDIVVNILSRVPRIHRPTLSLVSKTFRSLIASPELDATRALIGITHDCLYVCLNLSKKNPNYRWFVLAPTPNGHKLLPIPNSFSYQLEESKDSTVFSIGSEIYIIGGLLKGEIRRRSVFVLDCQTHRWSKLRDMCVPRNSPAVEVIDGKICVVGGCGDDHGNIEHWGEVYDPKTQTWVLLSPTTLDPLIIQRVVLGSISGSFIMGGKVYGMKGLKLNLKDYICLVEIKTNVFFQIFTSTTVLYWRANNDSVWRSVKGLEELTSKSYFPIYLVSVASSSGRRVTVLWKKVEYRSNERKTDIWCSEISFQRQGVRELKGRIEWSNSVFTLDRCDSDPNGFLHSVVVNH